MSDQSTFVNNAAAQIADSAQYLASIADQLNLMEQQPWDHHQRKGDRKRLQKRLTGERDALIALIHQEFAVFNVHLLIVASNDTPLALLQSTLLSWHAQSHPFARATVVAPPDLRFSEPELMPQRLVILESLDEHFWGRGASDEMLILAQPGDIFHPALATCLALQQADQMANGSDTANAWSWNRIIATQPCNAPYGASCYLRSPGASALTLLGGDYVGGAIAWRADWLAGLPRSALAAFASGDYQAALLRLASETGQRWQHYPEYLQISGRPPIATYSAAARREHGALARALYGGGWRERNPAGDTDGSGSLAIEPAGQVDGISVVIPFRDHIDNTLAAVQAIGRQSTTTWVEVVLVNNGSTASSLQQLEKGLESLKGGCTVKILDYPHGFSHSRQCNLGVAGASGEVVVILNNDAFLRSTGCLEQISRWAQLPEVATVGARITDKNNKTVCTGLHARLRTGFDFEAGFEESKDELALHTIREVFGNTGACFGILRKRFLELGGFNEVLYPIGFNDVEFCLRAREHGYRHVNIGWLQVEHEPGTSRGFSDEIMQKVSLRSRFPNIARDAQYQLTQDAHLKTGSTASTGARTGNVNRQANAVGRFKNWIRRAISK